MSAARKLRHNSAMMTLQARAPNLLQTVFLVACLPWAGCIDDALHPQSEPVGDHDPRICTPLDYGHTQSAEDFYRRFASDEEAATFIQKQLDSPALDNIAGRDATLIEITHDERIIRLLTEIVAGFSAVFPEAMNGISDIPRVALLHSDKPNAYAIMQVAETGPMGSVVVNPWLFVVHDALLAGNPSDTELRGVFGHELGHLILRNAYPPVRANILRSYQLKGSEDGVFGALQDNDAEVARHTELILRMQERVGGVPELGYPAVYGASYASVLLSLTQGAPACADLLAKVETLGQAQKKFLTKADAGDLTPSSRSDDEQADLYAQTAAIFETARSCDNGQALPLAALIATLKGLPTEAVDPAHPQHEQLEALLLEEEREIDEKSPQASLIERLILASESVRKRLLEERADPELEIGKLRVYDVEEDADDASVRVLRAIGDDPTGVAQFLAKLIPEQIARDCVADIEAGEPISFGDLRDQHPGVCWRLYNVERFSRALEGCPAPDGPLISVE